MNIPTAVSKQGRSLLTTVGRFLLHSLDSNWVLHKLIRSAHKKCLISPTVSAFSSIFFFKAMYTFLAEILPTSTVKRHNFLSK